MSSMGASEGTVRRYAAVCRTTITDEGEVVPSKFADTVDICRHQSHNLRLARKFVFIVLFGFLRVVLIVRGHRRRGRRDILADQGFRKKAGVELNFESNLDCRHCKRPQLRCN